MGVHLSCSRTADSCPQRLCGRPFGEVCRSPVGSQAPVRGCWPWALSPGTVSRGLLFLAGPWGFTGANPVIPGGLQACATPVGAPLLLDAKWPLPWRGQQPPETGRVCKVVPSTLGRYRAGVDCVFGVWGARRPVPLPLPAQEPRTAGSQSCQWPAEPEPGTCAGRMRSAPLACVASGQVASRWHSHTGLCKAGVCPVERRHVYVLSALPVPVGQWVAVVPGGGEEGCGTGSTAGLGFGAQVRRSGGQGSGPRGDTEQGPTGREQQA